MPKRRAITHAEHEATVRAELTDLTHRLTPVRANDASSAVGQGLAIATMLHSWVNKHYDAARDAALAQWHIPTEPGTHLLHDDAFVSVSVQIAAPPRKLSEHALVDMLCDRLDMDEAEARALLDTCRLAEQAGQRRLSVLLKR